jgi:tetratricopeptide (TPR) repeat protein
LGGLNVILPTTTALLGLAYALRGRIEEALPLIEESEAEIPESRILIFDTSTANIAPATVYLLAGRDVEAATAAARAAESSAAHGFRGNQAWASVLQAEVSMVGDPTNRNESETFYKRAQQLADEGGMRPLAAHAHFGLGNLYRETGDTELAEEHSLCAKELFRAMNMTPWLTRNASPQ